MSNDPDYYQILRVSKQSSLVEIKKAFRRLARQVHPDLHPNNPEAAAQFKRISEAYEVLSDPDRRSHYDTRFTDTPAEPEPSPAKSYGTLYRQATDKLTRLEYRDAIADFTRAIALSPESLEAYLGRCKAYDGVKDDRAVLDDCFQILQRDPKSVHAYLYQGQARLRLGYGESAIDAYTQAIALDETLAIAYVRRAQARIELRDVDLAYPDLKKAQSLYRAQQNWTQVQQAERLILGLKRPKPSDRAASSSPKSSRPESFSTASSSPESFSPESFSTASFSSRPSTQSHWALAFGSIFRLVFNPSDHLLPTFSRLTPRPAAWTGILYGLMMVGCIVLGRTAQLSSGFRPLNTELWRVGLMGGAAYLSLVLACAIARLLARGRGSFAGDFFLAGVVALPMAALALGGIFISGMGEDILRVITGCYSVLILYMGCTQISDMDEPRAMVAVPCIILTCFGIAAWVARAV
jgi:curved DNA-binding protein CbpA